LQVIKLLKITLLFQLILQLRNSSNAKGAKAPFFFSKL
jgi:hypothetical protein